MAPLITYTRKRTHPRPLPSSSSPLSSPDLDHLSSHSEMSRRMLKRSRASTSRAHDQSRTLSDREFDNTISKKLKSSPIPPTVDSQMTLDHDIDQHQLHFQTPHNTNTEKFQLNSSVGPPIPPDQFSPLPIARRIRSRNLKENNINSRSKSPSRSRSTSCRRKQRGLASPFNSRPSSPKNSTSTSTTLRTRPNTTRTLSDTHYNHNIPHPHSTSTSPTHAHSPSHIHTLARRPSDSQLTRAPTTNLTIHTPFILPSYTSPKINFDRPPSQLSFYSPAFFNDAQHISTPLSDHPCPVSSLFESPHLYLHPYAQPTATRPTTPNHSPHTHTRRVRSPWLSDSLISPPNTLELHDIDMELDAYNPPDADADMYVDVDHAQPDNALPSIFNAMHMGSHPFPAPNQPPPFPSRTRSLDSAAPITTTTHSAAPITKGRDRRGTIRASDFKFAGGGGGAGARRTRSGTIVGPGAGRTRSGTVVVPKPAAVVRFAFDEGVREDVEERGVETDGDGGEGEVESEDELLLRDAAHWCDEDWVVAAPPSPVVRRGGRRKRRVVEGEEDELLLGPGFRNNIWE